MKRMIFSLSFLWVVSGMYAQLTLEECQRKTQGNYPLVQQYSLVEKTKEYSLENAAKGYLPQLVLSAKASYQSEVTEIPVKLPGVDIKGLPKDQYQVVLELQQKIWDGGGIRMKKKQTTAEAEVEKEKLNVDMYALNSRVNDLYFGILLLDEQLRQNALLQDELERNYRQIAAYGNPGLNMLKNEFSPYYIAGVRLSWNFGSLYTLKNDRRVIENKRRQLDNNRDVFLFNTRLQMTQQDQAVRSLEKQMQDDDEIIRLRTNIRKAAEAKVAN